MKKDLEAEGYFIHKIQTSLNLEEGKIENVTITIDKTQKKQGEIAINKIDIGGKNEKSDVSQKEQDKIKQKISENYGVEQKNITVNSL